jgi:hypothetical protein
MTVVPALFTVVLVVPYLADEVHSTLKILLAPFLPICTS